MYNHLRQYLKYPIENRNTKYNEENIEYSMQIQLSTLWIQQLDAQEIEQETWFYEQSIVIIRGCQP